jgi:hypothetical protein
LLPEYCLNVPCVSCVSWQWSAALPLRVAGGWWEATLRPLRHLEMTASALQLPLAAIDSTAADEAPPRRRRQQGANEAQACSACQIATGAAGQSAAAVKSVAMGISNTVGPIASSPRESPTPSNQSQPLDGNLQHGAANTNPVAVAVGLRRAKAKASLAWRDRAAREDMELETKVSEHSVNIQ